MPKYINADEFERDCMFDRNCEDMQDVIYKLRDYPSADVVEVGPLRKRIEADLEEAKESFSDCENETDKSFQQGRIFAHNYDLFVIERILKKENDE